MSMDSESIIKDVIGKLKTHAQMTTGRPLNNETLKLLPSAEQCLHLAERLEVALNEIGLENKLVAAIAHRACCGTEHDPAQGKLHGYCVVCGVPWPCETAAQFFKL